MIDRRRLLRLLAGVPLLPAFATAADLKRAHVGFLTGFKWSPKYRAVFEEELKIAGFAAMIDERSAEGRIGRLPTMAREMVRTDVRLLVALDMNAIEALRSATTTIPIVMAGAIDPLNAGVIKSLARPGGNITGVSSGEISEGVSAKSVEILRELVPKLKRIAVLSNPANHATEARTRQIKAAAQTIGSEVMAVPVRQPEDFEAAFSTIAGGGVQGLIVVADLVMAHRIAAVIDFAARRRLPAIYGVSRYAEEGGLVSFGTNYVEVFRLAASRYAVPILNGKQPGEMPVEQFVGLELVVNRGVANRLGVAIPRALVARANRIID
jgi:putative ABC transport system substrate-binding protein